MKKGDEPEKVPKHAPPLFNLESDDDLGFTDGCLRREQLLEKLRSAISEFARLEPITTFEVVGILEILKFETIADCRYKSRLEAGETEDDEL